jgi:ureidoglycolate dehydrogenase (NAD+)
MSETAYVIDHKKIQLWAMDCLQFLDVPSHDALIVSDALIQTSLWGIDSHGIARLPHYLARIQAGSIEAKPAIQVKETGPCTAQLTGGHGLGMVICDQAMGVAIRLAQQNGVGVVGISESTHCGAIGLYSRKAALSGLIGIAFTHSDALVVPFGGKERFLGTNPISIAFPRLGSQPLCLDMATSAIPWNRVMNARRENQELPDGVAIDATGAFTTDPHKTSALFPLGGAEYGYKGYGLALMVDILCGPLNGMPFGPNVSVMYGDLSQRRNLGSLMLAIDPARFAGGPALAETVLQITQTLKQQPGTILFPGEPEYLCEERRRREGIPIEPGLLKEMRLWSEKLQQGQI